MPSTITQTGAICAEILLGEIQERDDFRRGGLQSVRENVL